MLEQCDFAALSAAPSDEDSDEILSFLHDRSARNRQLLLNERPILSDPIWWGPDGFTPQMRTPLTLSC